MSQRNDPPKTEGVRFEINSFINAVENGQAELCFFRAAIQALVFSTNSIPAQNKCEPKILILIKTILKKETGSLKLTAVEELFPLEKRLLDRVENSFEVEQVGERRFKN